MQRSLPTLCLFGDPANGREEHPHSIEPHSDELLWVERFLVIQSNCRQGMLIAEIIGLCT